MAVACNPEAAIHAGPVLPASPCRVLATKLRPPSGAANEQVLDRLRSPLQDENSHPPAAGSGPEAAS